jgi:hypothetical protein
MFVLLWCALLGAVGRRICGGGLQDLTGLDVGDVPVRVFFGLCLGMAALLGGAGWLVVAVVAVGTFLSCSLPIHWRLGGVEFGGVAMGRNPAHDWWNDVAGLLLHALLGIGVVGLLVTVAGGNGWRLVLAALAIVGCYEAGWRITGPVPRSNWPRVVSMGHYWGELFWGALCGLAAGVSTWP